MAKTKKTEGEETSKTSKTSKGKKVAKSGDSVTTTTTTTTTTVETKSVSDSKSGLSKKTKVIIFASAGVVALLVVFFFVVLGRVNVPDNSMECGISEGEKLFFNRFGSPDRGDIVVFRHPEADSIVPGSPDKNYYKMCRMYGNGWISKSEVVANKLGKRPVYVSRCMACPGEIIEIKNNTVYVNSKRIAEPENGKRSYFVVKDGLLNSASLDSIGLTKSDIAGETDYADDYFGFYRNLAGVNSSLTIYSMNDISAKKLSRFVCVKNILPLVLPSKHYIPTVFPYSNNPAFSWNESNFGPLLVPVKGKLIKLNERTIKLYGRIIEAFEGNKLEVKNGTIFINDKQATAYKFKKNYYFVLSDNRSSKNDSRYFGFLPEDHVLGTAL